MLDFCVSTMLCRFVTEESRVARRLSDISVRLRMRLWLSVRRFSVSLTRATTYRSF